MTSPDPKKIAELHIRRKTAGEVRFVKDRGGDHAEWAWGNPGPSQRELGQFEFNPKFLKPLAMTLRSTLMALGHATSAHARLVKVKSRNVSPDGALGGRGYIQKIPEMRRQLMNVIEVLSASSDTLYDEINAPHWSADAEMDIRDREEVKDIIEDAETIREDPEGWAEEEEQEELDESEEKAKGKKASFRSVVARHESSAPALLQRAFLDTSHINLRSVKAAELERVTGDLSRLCSDLKSVKRSFRQES